MTLSNNIQQHTLTYGYNYNDKSAAATAAVGQLSLLSTTLKQDSFDSNSSSPLTLLTTETTSTAQLTHSNSKSNSPSPSQACSLSHSMLDEADSNPLSNTTITTTAATTACPTHESPPLHHSIQILHRRRSTLSFMQQQANSSTLSQDKQTTPRIAVAMTMVDSQSVEADSNTTSTPVTAPSLLSSTRSAVRRNLFPGLLLQCLAILIVVLYYTSTCPAVFEQVSRLKTQWGFGFSALTQCIAGGVIPALIIGIQEWRADKINVAMKQTGGNSKRIPSFGCEHLYLCLFWLLKGIEVDGFYRLQALIFGSGATPKQIIPKVIVDQFIYSPPWGTSSCVVAYLFKDVNFSFKQMKAALNKHFFTFQLPSSIISGWCVWIPAASLIYCLPSSLQIPLFNLVSCFWALLMAVLVKKQPEESVKHKLQENISDNNETDKQAYLPVQLQPLPPSSSSPSILSPTMPPIESPTLLPEQHTPTPEMQQH